MTPLSRRSVLLGGLGTAAATALAGCAGAGTSSSADTMQFWHLLSGGDGATIQALIDDANASQNEYFVRPTVLAWGAPYYTKLAMAGAGGRAPDLAAMHSSRVPGYAPGGLLDPWDLDRLAEHGVTEADFSGPIWESAIVDGDVFSVALDAHPFICLYNTEICEAAGVLDVDGRLQRPDTPEEYLSMCREIAGHAEGHALSYGFLDEGPQMWRFFYTLYAQHGTQMEFPQGGTAQIDGDAFVSSLEMMHSIIDDEIGSSRATEDSAIAEFAAGRSGMHYTGVWELATMEDAGVPLDAGTIPPIFGHEAVFADSHSFVLPHQSNPDEQMRSHAYDLVAQLLKSSYDWAGAGHIPAYLPVTEDPQYRELVPQAHYAEAADHLVYDPPAWFTGSGSNFHLDFGQIVSSAITSGSGFDEAYESFQSHVDRILSRPNPANPEEGSDD